MFGVSPSGNGKVSKVVVNGSQLEIEPSLGSMKTSSAYKRSPCSRNARVYEL
jgi:hypothetical protein